MNILIIAAIFIAIILLAMNIYVTYLLAKSEFFEPVQKYSQYALIWLFPVIGVVVCYLFVQPDLEPPSGRYLNRDEAPEGEFMDFARSNKDYFSGHD
ncbi:hypothetical protein H8L32_23420 [Undibacterium sp. CY18W]|uniref:Uncharacterized protein n=1 Tax=Undibacterium hunanense TaxID=2762292 RepID=A0ABR6ZX34_9BURK|nr:hypothetical protein [Undibacterium hunanense]MBC3920433.1 hypothetical protein [Undibacterium hunanense]